LNIFGRTGIQNNRYQMCIRDLFMSAGRAVYTDRRPNYLAMMNMIFRPDVVINYLHDHFRTELADTGSADTREFFCNAVSYGIFQCFG
jgi:hypothetical protein